MLNRSRRLVLARSTLAAIPVHISIVVAVAPWAIKAIETLIRGFLWYGSEATFGGKCAFAWVNISWPTNLEGLGIPNLQLLGMALRLRWLWLARTDTMKAWSALRFPQGKLEKSFFEASISVMVGNGEHALFWLDNWIDECSIKTLESNLWAAVPARTRNSRTVRDGLIRQ